MKNFAASLTLALILAATGAMAQWSTNASVNNVINNLPNDQAIPKIANCPNGDSYFGFFSSEGGNYDVRLQRLDYQGNALWTPGGIMVSSNPQNTWLTDWDMTADLTNHAILVFNDIRNAGNMNIYAYSIANDGTFTWGANGIALSNSSAFNAAPKVVVTNAGNIVVAWSADNNIIMQKISPTGTLLWGTSGISIIGPNRNTWPQLVAVGTDDVILKYYDDSGSTLYPTRHIMAQRYNASGVAVWSSPTAISLAGGISSQTQVLPIISDGNDGLYIGWHDDRDNNMKASIFVQHVNSSGVCLWTTNGVEVSSASSMNHYYPQLALPTGSTDLFCYWNEMNGNQDQWGIYGQKINSTGALQWGATGMVFIAVGLTDVYPVAARKSPTDMVLFYEDYFNTINSSIKAMRISTTGTYVWTPNHVTMCSVNSQKVHTVVNEFASNQWIASWEDNRSGNADIYAQNIKLDGTLGPGLISNGTISGTITLSGGTGSVTNVTVQAGTYSATPNASGFYTMTVPTGTYTVTASLAGYNSASQNNVVVNQNQTTTVNLTLTAIPMGYIDGHVTLVGGSGILSQVQVTAGTTTVNPDITGHYTMFISPGTYNVIATLPAYFPDTVKNVVVLNNQTTNNVNLTLNLAPYTGHIEGTVTLNGGSGNVTQAVVNAGGFTTNPNASGFYSIEVPAGSYDVSASLSGYVTQIIPSVVVLVSQTTSNVNFTLVPSASAGTISGLVTISGGTASVQDAVVTAGTYSTHPDAGGVYSLQVPAGTYTVTASHPYTNTQSVNNVSVTQGNTTPNVNFVLTVDKADLVCIALSNSGGYLNPVSLVIQGPGGPYTGTITQDSLIFPMVPYGAYSGISTWNGVQLQSDTTVGATNHHLIFQYTISGTVNIAEGQKLSVSPNPAGAGSTVKFSLIKPGTVRFDLTDGNGRTVRLTEIPALTLGSHEFSLGTLLNGVQPGNGLYFLRLQGPDGTQTCKFVVSF
jgi:hypothetical protein